MDKSDKNLKTDTALDIKTNKKDWNSFRKNGNFLGLNEKLELKNIVSEVAWLNSVMERRDGRVSDSDNIQKEINQSKKTEIFKKVEKPEKIHRYLWDNNRKCNTTLNSKGEEKNTSEWGGG